MYMHDSMNALCEYFFFVILAVIHVQSYLSAMLTKEVRAPIIHPCTCVLWLFFLPLLRLLWLTPKEALKRDVSIAFSE